MLVVAAGGVGYVVMDRGPDETIATVTSVDSGDTLTVELDGQSRTLHLTNLAAPADGECLGSEAQTQLAAYAPEGTELRLEIEGTPPASGDLTAAAFLSDGRLLSAAMAEDGLGYVVSTGKEGAYQWDVRTAQEEARYAGLGLFSPQIDCTIPGQVFAVSDRVEAATLTMDTNAEPEVLEAQRDELDALLADASSLVEVMGAEQGGAVWDVLRMSDRIGFSAQAQTSVATLQVARSQVEQALNGDSVVTASNN